MSYIQELTSIGLAKIATALGGGPPVIFTELAIGSGNLDPSSDPTTLVAEESRVSVNSVTVNADGEVVVEAVFGAAIGGFTVREAAAFDATGDLLLAARVPDAYKPDPATDGASTPVIVRLKLAPANAPAVAVTVDDSIIIATREHVAERSIGSLIHMWETFA